MSKTVFMPGAPVADAVFADLAPRIQKLIANGRTPGLATLLVGEDDASARYVGMKHKKVRRWGATRSTSISGTTPPRPTCSRPSPG